MIKVEIVLNQSLKDDFLEKLDNIIPSLKYTFLDGCKGKGSKGRRLMNNIWPEENCLFISFVEDIEFQILSSLFIDIKEIYINEGIKFFYTKGVQELKYKK